MAVQFATAEQFFEFQGMSMPPSFSDEERMALDAMLTRASTRIRRATRLALVRYRNDGIPANGTVAEGYARATVWQAVWWKGQGDDGSGAAGRFDSVSMDGVSYSRSTSAAAAAQTTAADDRISPEAMEELSVLPIWGTGVRNP